MTNVETNKIAALQLHSVIVCQLLTARKAEGRSTEFDPAAILIASLANQEPELIVILQPRWVDPDLRILRICRPCQHVSCRDCSYPLCYSLNYLHCQGTRTLTGGPAHMLALVRMSNDVSLFAALAHGFSFSGLWCTLCQPFHATVLPCPYSLIPLVHSSQNAFDKC